MKSRIEMHKFCFISKFLFLLFILFLSANMLCGADEVNFDIVNLDMVSPAMDDTSTPVFDSQNKLDFNDPCICTDPLNCEFGGVYYFHDSLKVTVGGGGTIMVVPPATNFFIDCAGTPLTTGVAMTLTSTNMYKFEYWRPSGAIPSVMVSVRGATAVAVPATTFEPACFRETCNPVPTLGQWGLMILATIFVIVGIVAVIQRSVKRIE